MSAPEAPKDNSLKIARLEMAERRRAEQQARRDERRERRQLRALRQSAMGNARSSSEQFFLDQGLDPSEYMNEIDQAIKDAMQGIAKDDPAPGMYLKSVGQDVFDRQTNLARMRASSGLDALFDDDFDTDRIADTIDDAILNAIYEEERGRATEILDNMRARRVITDSGYNAGIKDLDRQAPSARARLTTLGDAEIAKGRSKLRGIVNTGRSTAAKLKLGQNFDPTEYSSDVDAAFDSWLSGLSDSLRAVKPSDLFATGSLASIAGQGQGAQNTVFNPKALAGVVEEDEQEEDETPENVF